MKKLFVSILAITVTLGAFSETKEAEKKVVEMKINKYYNIVKFPPAKGSMQELAMKLARAFKAQDKKAAIALMDEKAKKYYTEDNDKRLKKTFQDFKHLDLEKVLDYKIGLAHKRDKFTRIVINTQEIKRDGSYGSGVGRTIYVKNYNGKLFITEWM